VGDHPVIDADWHATSNNLVVLQCDDIPSLADRLDAAGIKLSRFTEPDLDDALTAIAVEPDGWRHLSSLALADETTEAELSLAS